MNLGLTLGLGGRAAGGVGGFVPDFYVDSVNGSDSNDGLTAATAFQTLGKVETEAATRGNGTRIGLLRGFDQRSRLNTAGLTNVTVGVTGTGAVPIIRCTDVATGWTQPDAVTYPNVWQRTGWTSDLINNNFRLTAYRNGVEMPLAATTFTGRATPNATELTALNGGAANRSLVRLDPTGNDNIYIHSTTDPNSNGATYEVSKRISGIYSNTTGTLNFTVTGPLIVENAPWVSGGVVSAGGATFRRIGTRDSARGSFLTSGLVEDCIYSGGSTRTNAGTSNQLVFYTSIPGTYPGTVRRCGFIAGDNPDQPWGEDMAALFSHNDQPGVIHDCASEQCWSVAMASLGGFRATSPVHNGFYAKNAGSFNLQAGSVTKPLIRYGLFNGGVATTQLSSWDAVHRFEHCVSYDAKMLRKGDGFEVQNCIWWKSGNQNALTQPIDGGVPNLAVNNSICVCNGWSYAIDLAAGTTYTGNNNIFASFFTGRQARFRYNNVNNDGAGATQYKLKWWQDQTGQDANSVYILPADQTAGGANALWLAYAQAAGGTSLSTIGPAVGDFRINPNARVYSGADVAYIGTFPNGDPLVTNVGPQFHWDWNARAVASGPPTRWPDVPETEAEQATYIANPTAWDFYP